MKSIGIISGAGPLAGIVLHQKIIYFYNKKGIYKDKDFPLIKHISFPFFSTDISGVFDFYLSKKELSNAISMCSNVDKIYLACNSLLLSVPPEFQELVFDPRKTITQKIKNKEVVILASQSSIENEIYKNISTSVKYPSHEIQNKINTLIEKVMRGLKNNSETKKQFNELIAQVSHKYPQDVILLGCTELCVFEPIENCINVLDIIAEHI